MEILKKMWSYIVFAAEFREPTNAHDVVNLDTRHPARLLKAYRGTYLERMEDLRLPVSIYR